MADEPENLVLQMLRDIRGKLDEHTRLLNEHTRLLNDHTKQLLDVRETAILAVGLATMANYKLDKLVESVEDHEIRIETLEHDRPRPAGA